MKAKLSVIVLLGALVLHSCTMKEEIDTPVDLGASSTISMVVPAGCRKVRVEYPTTDSFQSVMANITPQPQQSGGRDASAMVNASIDVFSSVNTYVNIYDESDNLLVANYPVRAKSVPSAGSVQLPEDAVSEYVTGDGPFVFYHSSGVAMFNDIWPYSTDTIDADFSDVVIDYDIETKTVDIVAAPHEAWRECIKVVMHLRTVGGMFPTAAGLALEGLDTRYIDRSEVRLTLGNTNKNIPANSLSYTVDISGSFPIITLDNIAWLNSAAAKTATYINSKTGLSQGFIGGSPAPYYNVTPGYINKGGDLFTLTVIFWGKDRRKIANGNDQLANYINAVMNTESQNFFIRTKNSFNGNTHEIHLKGYNPTPAYAAKYATDNKIGVGKSQTATYCSAAGYTWGIKVPVLTRHAWEEESFYQAYPGYGDWVTSNGALSPDWYKYPDTTRISDWW